MILITGAAGFIGSAVAHALNKRGESRLILADRFGTAEKWMNLRGLEFHQFVDRGQLFDALKRETWASQITAVIHMGACADTTMRDVDYLYEWNVDYSRKLCEWTLAQNARFIYASSAATYGDGSLGFSDDDELTPKLRPLNAYGFSKWLFDRMVLDRGWQKRVAGLRFFNVFGPNEYHKGRMASVVMHAYPQARDTGKVRLFESHRDGFGHGEQRRDFIHIEEVLAGILFLLDRPQVNGIFNLGTGMPHTYNQLAENVFKALGKPANIEYFPMPEDLRGRYQYETRADMTKLLAAGLPQFPDRFAEYVQSYVKDYMHAGMKYLADV
ncbi:ADP-glyceromanno-heptose 6-epimerase [bacterium]|nr:ADP-glyceromanno-heptose 6-epimerase [bacterium]